MPGRTVAEAFRNFIGPIKSATGCLGKVNLTISAGGTSDPDRLHGWVLGDGSGIRSGSWTYNARMTYRFLKEDNVWRVTTRGYSYGLSYGSEELWRMDWHPISRVSPLPFPHLHLNYRGLLPDDTDTSKQHLPTGRFTYEDSIRWAGFFGFPLAHSDAFERLNLAEERHLEHRSWGGNSIPDVASTEQQ